MGGGGCSALIVGDIYRYLLSLRFEALLFQRIQINMRILTVLINYPIDEIAFHVR